MFGGDHELFDMVDVVTGALGAKVQQVQLSYLFRKRVLDGFPTQGLCQTNLLTVIADPSLTEEGIEVHWFMGLVPNVEPIT